jgi:hypothetical protein
MNAIDWGALVGLLLLLFLVFLLIRPSISRSRVIRARRRLIQQIEARRGSRVIVMIERQKIGSFLGMPPSCSLDIEDPAEVRRTIRLTLRNVPIDLIVHTTGALALAAEPIADALVRHNAPVTLMVPHYAMSGGTRLALASDKVLMSPSAVLGPETCPPGSQPTLGVLESLAEVLGDGCWTHPAPITFEIARELGMAVSDELPDEAYRLVDLYPQAADRPPSLQPVPISSPSDDAPMPEPEKA